MTDADRRALLGGGLALAFASLARDAWAQNEPAAEFSRLRQPVRIPLSELSTPWRVCSFAAESEAPPGSPNAGQRVHMKGMILRTASGDDALDRFRPVCAVCPHEGCEVDFLPAPKDLPAEIGAKVHGPIYMCPCHSSIFSPASGGYIDGPAPRGLFLFRLTGFADGSIEIGEIEKEANDSTGWWSPGRDHGLR